MQTDTAGNLIKYVKNIRRRQFKKNSLSLNDLLQEAWCVRLKCQSNFDPEYGLTYEQFERMCVYRHLLNLINAAHKKQTAQYDEVPDKVDNGPSPVNLAIKNELLGRLNKFERFLLEEHYFRGQSFADIGRKLGRSRQAIKLVHDRILRTMRTWLNA